MRFLDDHFEDGWEGRINHTTLNIGCTRTCMMGQLIGDYEVATASGGVLFQENAKSLGFFPTRRVLSDVLTAAWLRALRRRQEEREAVRSLEPELPLAA